MARLIMFKGISGSGKSTEATKLVRKGYVRVNMDDLRSSLNLGKFSRGNEKVVQETAYNIVESALERGRHVVWDNTSLHPKHESRLRDIAKKHRANFEVQTFDIEPRKAVQRDLRRERSVGPKVIWDQYYNYVWQQPAQQPKTGVPAVIIDVDGTLMRIVEGPDGTKRSPYDHTRVHEDQPVQAVADLVSNIDFMSTELVFLSGRSDACYQATAESIVNAIGHDQFMLYMRAEGDSRSDRIVKRELHDEHIRGKYDVQYVIDDREQVVQMWTDELGYTVLQVRQPGVYNDF